VQTNLPEYTSVSGVSPTGTYSRNTDTITVPKTIATSYPNNNFGDANLNVVLTEDGQHTITAGEVTDYPHRLSTQAPVQLTQLFKVIQTQIMINLGRHWFTETVIVMVRLMLVKRYLIQRKYCLLQPN
jgi:hypothetical protein